MAQKKKKAAKKSAKKKSAKKKATKKKVAKKAARRASTAGAVVPSGAASWSDSNVAHKTTFGLLVYFGQFKLSLSWDDVGKLKMEQLQFWPTGSSADMERKAARDFCTSFLKLVLTGRPTLEPRSGTTQQDKNAAYDAVEAVFAGKANTVAKLGRELDSQYVGWL